MNTKCLLVLGLMSLSGTTWAQACPGGIPSAGNPGCIPPNNSASPYYQQTPNLQFRRPEWQLTWGAIATDSNGNIGVAVGHLYEWTAKRKALSRCRTFGIGDCKINLTYENQCAVFADPTENGKTISGKGAIQSASSIEVATQLALTRCSAQNGGRQCKIIYSDCTQPVLVK